MNAHLIIDSLKHVVLDSLTASFNQQNNVYKTILEQQQGTYQTITYIWIAITGILISGTLFWNFYIANRKIESEVTKRKAELIKEFDEKYSQLEKTLQKQSADAELLAQNKLDESLKKIGKEIDENFEKHNKKNTNTLKKIEADIHRSFAVSARESGNFWTAILQAMASAYNYQDRDQGEMVSTMLKFIIICLRSEKCEANFIKNWNKGGKEMELMNGFLEVGLNNFSSYLKGEKEEIRILMTELRNKTNYKQ